MAEGGGGGAGKIVSSCSCLSMVCCLFLILFINFGLTPLIMQFPDMAQLGAILGSTGALVANLCCCFSGVGLIVGIVMLLMGKKGDDGA